MSDTTSAFIELLPVGIERAEIEEPTLTGTSPFSLEAWIKPSVTSTDSSYRGVVDKDVDSPTRSGWILGLYKGTVRCADKLRTASEPASPKGSPGGRLSALDPLVARNPAAVPTGRHGHSEGFWGHLGHDVGNWGKDALHAGEAVGTDVWHVVDQPAALKTAVDALGMATSITMVAAGVGGEGVGVLLDITGVGAIVGIPINVASAGLIAVGVGGVVVTGDAFVHNLETTIHNASANDAGGAGANYDNPRHHDPNGGPNPYDPNKSVLPPDAEAQFQNSVQTGQGVWWTKIGTGRNAVYYRYFDDGNESWHWSGSTNSARASGSPNPIPLNRVPISVQRS